MPKDLPGFLYRAEQVRALDRAAIEDHGIPAFTLMKRAGKACLHFLRQQWPGCRHLVVLCGSGNNAGDGYVIAGAAATQRLRVTLVQLGDTDRLTPTAQRARAWARKRGVRATDALPVDLDPATDVLVDALLGIGLSGELRPACREWVEWINSRGVPVCAADVPTGLCADSGRVLGAAVRADLTVTFIGLKRGQFTGAGPAHCGRVRFAGLEVPETVYDTQVAEVRRIRSREVDPWRAPRRRDAHKGHFGHVLVVGGDHGMGGAVALAAEAALRTGAGLVSVATRSANVPSILARRPECMVHAVESGQDLQPLLASCSVLVAGPGFGRGAWATQLLQQVLSFERPRVLDADALNLLAAGAGRLPLGGPVVITPHPGEAARLLGGDSASVQADRYGAVARLQAQTGATVVLKGSGTLVAAASGSLARPAIGVCLRGNPGMASGGMGDTLSGIIGGLLAQHVPADEAASAGVWLHAAAADHAARARGERGLLASDLFEPLGRLLNP